MLGIKNSLRKNFYDGIIVHSYAKVTKGKDRFGQMISEVAEGTNKKDAFNIYKKELLIISQLLSYSNK